MSRKQKVAVVVGVVVLVGLVGCGDSAGPAPVDPQAQEPSHGHREAQRRPLHEFHDELRRLEAMHGMTLAEAEEIIRQNERLIRQPHVPRAPDGPLPLGHRFPACRVVSVHEDGDEVALPIGYMDSVKPGLRLIATRAGEPVALLAATRVQAEESTAYILKAAAGMEIQAGDLVTTQ